MLDEENEHDTEQAKAIPMRDYLKYAETMNKRGSGALRRISFPSLMLRLAHRVKDRSDEGYFQVSRAELQDKIEVRRDLKPFALYMPQPLVY